METSAFSTVLSIVKYAALAFGVLLAIGYAGPVVRRCLEQGARTIFQGLTECITWLTAAIRRAGGAGAHITRHVTRDGRIPLIGMLLILPVLAALNAVVLSIDVQNWANYFKIIMPGDLALGPVNIPAGVLRAVVIVAFGFLIGYGLEGALGLVPFPWVGHQADEQRDTRIRRIILIVVGTLWIMIAIGQVDVALQAYQEQGVVVCQSEALDNAPIPTLDVTGPTTPDASSVSSQDSINQCLDQWKTNDQAKSAFVVIAEVALWVTLLFAWTVFAVAGLIGYIVLGLLIVLIGFSLVLLRFMRGLISLVWYWLDQILVDLHALGAWIARHLGLPHRENDPPNGGSGPGAGGGGALPPGADRDSSGAQSMTNSPRSEQAASPPPSGGPANVVGGGSSLRRPWTPSNEWVDL